MSVHVKKNGKLEYLTTGQAVPQVGKLFIDKLTMTCPVPENHHDVTIARFIETVNSGYAIKSPVLAYKHSIKLSTANESDIFFQCAPQDPKYNFFRLECNPAKADMNYIKTQLDQILGATGGYSGLISKGVVTRIDFTVDADYISPTDILAHYPKMKVEKHYAKNGTIETKYLGDVSSNKQIVLYDKPAEIVHANKKKGKWLKSVIPYDKRLRIEIRLCNTSRTINELLTLPNPFKGLQLSAYPEPMTMESYDSLWTLFLSACRFEGVKNALLHFNEHDREFYKKRLITEGKTNWWKPEKVWQELPAALKVVTDVKGYHPTLQK